MTALKIVVLCYYLIVSSSRESEVPKLTISVGNNGSQSGGLMAMLKTFSDPKATLPVTVGMRKAVVNRPEDHLEVFGSHTKHFNSKLEETGQDTSSGGIDYKAKRNNDHLNLNLSTLSYISGTDTKTSVALHGQAKVLDTPTESLSVSGGRTMTLDENFKELGHNTTANVSYHQGNGASVKVVATEGNSSENGKITLNSELKFKV